MNHFFRLLLFVCGFAITLTACTNEDNGEPQALMDRMPSTPS